jgi:hypothetical protein
MEMSADPYNALGFLFGRNHPKDLNEYSGFYYKNWDQNELVEGMHFGILPSGLILRAPYGKLMVVMQSKLYPLAQDLKIIKNDNALL